MMLKAFFRDRVQNVRFKLVVTAVLLVYVAVCAALKLPCPIMYLTGIPCPGCGMTRALLSAVSLDFAAAFGFHFMFWSLPMLYLLFLCDGRLFSRKSLNAALLTLMGVGFLANWIRHFI